MGMMSGRLLQLASRRAFALSAARRINLSAVSRAQIPEGYAKLKEEQKMFQLDDGKRIHERGGSSNRLIYQFTKLLVLIGTVLFCDFFWRETQLGISLGVGSPKK